MFIWEKEVKEITGTLVQFVDGSECTFTQKALDYIVTEESKDPSAFQELIVENVAQAVLKAFDASDRYDADIENVNKIQDLILTVFEEHDIRKGDLTVVIQRVIDKYWRPFDLVIKQVGYSYNDTLDECIAIAFNTRGSSEYVDECVRNVRISDMKKLRSSYFDKT